MTSIICYISCLYFMHILLTSIFILHIFYSNSGLYLVYILLTNKENMLITMKRSMITELFLSELARLRSDFS